MGYRYLGNWEEREDNSNIEEEILTAWLTKPIRDRAAKYDYPLDKNIVELLNKERFIELLHDFIVYDRGIKKFCRPNQYFGVKAAQDHVRRKEGGIVWHTQELSKTALNLLNLFIALPLFYNKVIIISRPIGEYGRYRTYPHRLQY